jgi:hypothetical protein
MEVFELHGKKIASILFDGDKCGGANVITR